MSGETPEQAAYEAWRDRMERTVSFAHPLPGWGDLPDGTRAAWKDAARAGTVTAWRLLDETRAELDRMRGLVRQALEDAGLPDDLQAEWLERAGIEAMS